MSLKEEKYIGKGSYGTVKKMKNGNKVVKSCKVFCYDNINESDFYLDEHSIKEAIFYQIVNKNRLLDKNIFHTCIPDVIVSIEHNQSLFFEMDYLGKPLNTFKHHTKEHTIQLFGNILEGLHSLHSLGYTHGDLKPDNILINNKGEIYIIDFGSICYWHHPVVYPHAYQRCTLYYVSPEELHSNNYSEKNDIWSFGVILFEWLTDLTFIRTLLKECNVNEKDQQLFHDYTCNNKTDTSFNPTLYLSQFYKSIQYSHIYGMLTKYIKDRDFVKVIGHCLLTDTQIRCTSKKLLDSIVFQRIPYHTNIIQETEVSNGNMNDPLREYIQDQLWYLCESNTKFTTSIYCHSIALFDRILLRLNAQNIYIPHLILGLCCTVLSAMILKSTLLKATHILDIYNTIKGKKDDYVSITDLRDYFGIIFSSSQFFLYNKSIDMYLMDESIEINYTLIRNICKKHILTSSTITYLVNLYKTQIKEQN